MHTSTNPFEDSNTRTLKDAFPALDGELIEDVLRSVNGNMEQAFDNLLRMSDPESTTSPPAHSHAPPIPQRRGRHCNSRITPRRTSSDDNNPFLNGCRSNTRVRQDLAQWRQQLAEESRQRRQCSRGGWRAPARLNAPNHNTSTASFSSTIPQDWRNYSTTSLTDLVETGRQNTIKMANDFRNRIMQDVNEISRNALGVPAYRLQHSHSDIELNTRTRPSPPVQRPSPPPPSIPVDRNRPLPTPPQASDSTHSVNPFDPHFTANDDLPPPAYEAHYNDRPVEPHDLERIMQSSAQTRSM